GRILTRVTQDVSTLNELFAQGVVAVIGDIFLLAGIIGAMLFMNWKLALVVFTTVPLLVLATAIFRAKVRVSYRKVSTRQARINAYLQEHLQGVEVVKLFNVETKAFRGFDRANKDHYRRTSRTCSITRSSSRPWNSSGRSRWRSFSGTGASGFSRGRSRSASWWPSCSTPSASTSRSGT